jgi:hypothetical protein
MKTSEELRAFYQFVGEKLATGAVQESPEDLLDEWREMHPEPLEVEDDVDAIAAALDDLDNGVAGMPLTEFDRKVRKYLKM